MMTIRTMTKHKDACIVKLDRSTLRSILRTFTQGIHSVVMFDKEWIKEFPYGRTAVSIERIREIRISPDLVGKPLREEVYINLIEKPMGHYILKIGPARFESSKQRGLSLEEFLQKWQELYPEQYEAWKEGENNDN